MNVAKWLSRSLVLTLGVLALPGCNGDQTKMANQPVVPPVEPEFAPIVSVHSNRSRLTAGETDKWAVITVTAVDAETFVSLPDGTAVLLSTNVGSFNGPSGEQEFETFLYGGSAKAFFFAGTEAGLASIVAEVEGVVALVRVTIVCPEEGCVTTEPPPFF